MNLVVMISVILIYLAVIAYLGYQGYRKTSNDADYLLAGRNTHPFVMALSYGATFISTSAIVGFGGVAAGFGLSLLWLTFLNIFVGIFIAFVFFGRRTRRMGLNLDAHTFPEFMARRVKSPFIQVFTGGVIFLFMPIYTAAVLIGAARIIESLMGIDYNVSIIVFTVLVGTYVIMGGLKGVMYTDALQGSLMFLGLMALLFFTFNKLGGIGEGHRALAAIADRVPQGFQAAGITGWTEAPVAGSPMWWTIFSSIVLGVGIGVLVQPQLVVRFMTVKSNRELNQAVLIGGIFILASTGTAFVVGALSNAYFFREYGQIALEFAGGNMDKIIPMYISEVMPNWFNYLFMLVILSAGMSTLSSQFHAIGTSIGRDIYEKGIRKDKKSDKAVTTLITRIGIVIALIVTVAISYKMGPGVIARATAIFFGIMASGFLAPYIASVYWKRYTKQGAVAGIVSGIVMVVFSFLFLHGKEAAVFGICEKLFGRTTLLGGVWPVVDPMVIALPVSILFTIVVSLLTKVEDKELVEKCFKGVK